VLSVGIIGPEGAGKSSLFRALTRGVRSSGRSTMGTVPVPDERLQILAEMVHPKRIVPTGCQFVDVGAVARGASQQGGLGAQFLSSLQGVDALAVVVRFFSLPDYGSGSPAPTPIDDLEGLLLEIGLSDLSRVQRRLERTTKAARSGDQAAKREEALLLRLHDRLDAGNAARGVDASPDELEGIKDLGLLTLKPMIFVANVDESDLAAALNGADGAPADLSRLHILASTNGADVAVVSAATESELADLAEADAREYLESLGVTKTGIDRFVQSAYRLLGLLTFFTAGEPEVRAWTTRTGSRAPEAARQIHSDIERGFIRAEVTAWTDLVEAGSPEAAKRSGKTRLEGKDYVMQEGDVVYFRFNV
jgi:GTP-binding protein YchF